MNSQPQHITSPLERCGMGACCWVLVHQDFSRWRPRFKSQLGKTAGDAVKYGDLWTVKVPTNLVRLRYDDKLPVWILDKITGDWIEQDDKGPWDVRSMYFDQV